jgi:hypothetical protein
MMTAQQLYEKVENINEARMFLTQAKSNIGSAARIQTTIDAFCDTFKLLDLMIRNLGETTVTVSIDELEKYITELR